MISLKKLATYAFVGFSLSATATTVNYTKTSVIGPAKNWGTLKSESYDVAICLNDPTLRDSKVISISAPVSTSEGLANPKAFITTKLSTTKVDGVRVNNADIETVDAVFDGNTIKATFKTPYTLTDNPVYVGFSFDIECLNESNRQPLVGMAAYNEGGFYVRTSRDNTTWVDKCESDNFTTSLSVVLEGDFSNAMAAIRLDQMIYCEQFKPFNAPVTYINQGGEPLKKIEYTWQLGDATGNGVWTSDTPMTVEFGREYPLYFLIDANVEKGYKDLTISVNSVNGQPNTHPDRVATRQIRVVSRVPVKRPVVEEYTGTWCGFCTRGIASMEHMRHTYGDEFVGIAYHQDSSSPDPMYCVTIVPNAPGSLPTCFIDRFDKMDPYHGRPEGEETMAPKDYAFIRFWQRYAEEFSPAAITMTADWGKEDPNEIEIHTEVVFVDAPSEKYGLEYILTADGIVGDYSNTNWLQKNSNMGVTAHIPEMERFSRGGSYVPTEFEDVALKRSGYKPVENSLPDMIEADKVNVHNYTIQAGSIKSQHGYEMIQDRNKLRVAALVVSRDTGRVINAVQVKVGGNTGIDSPAANREISDIEYFDLNGRRINSPSKGIYLKVTKFTDGTTKTDKLYIE